MRGAADGEVVEFEADGQRWVVTWHPPPTPPGGEVHGANAFCVTDGSSVVLISMDGERWGWPGGRTEPGETWEDTMRREMAEEACVSVSVARLLGFVRAECVEGQQSGDVFVRSIWRADVEVLDWNPQFEIPHRRIVPTAELDVALWMEPGLEPIYDRARREAGL